MNTTATLWNRHWRIVVVGVLGAALAFAGSFLVAPTYTSTTRLLIRGRDATFLTSTGQNLSSQPGVVDSTLSQSLASTYAGIATSRGVAVAVVDDLRLDQVPEKDGLIDLVAGAAAWTYRCTRAFLTAGFCADVDPYEKAVDLVQNGTSAQPLGTNAGSSAGMNGSYVLEVQGSGRTAEEARAVTDAVADELVATSRRRFETEAGEAITRLKAVVAESEAAVDARSKELATYQTESGVIAADPAQSYSAATYENIRADLIKAQADEADLRAQLSGVKAALASTPRGSTTSQTIVTGRSTTKLDSEGQSSVYDALLEQQGTIGAKLDGMVARVNQLSALLGSSKPVADNETSAELASRVAAVTRAQETLARDTEALRTAQVNLAQGPVDLTRLDAAATPVYPDKPERYIYLLLGLLFGAVAGGVVSELVWRRRRPEGDRATSVQSPDVVLDDEYQPEHAPEPVPARDGAHRNSVVDRLFSDDR